MRDATEPVNTVAARNTLSRLLVVASGGQEVVIARRGVPVARLVAFQDEAAVHTAAGAADWLAANAAPARRSVSQLDAQIAADRV